MKKFLIITFMIVGATTYAQIAGSGENKTPQNNTKMIEIQTQKMKTVLGLTDDQATQIQVWITKQEQNREMIREQAKAMKVSGQPLTDAQKTELKTKMDALKTAVDAELKNILTPEQYVIWQNNQKVTNEQYENYAPKITTAG